MGLRSRDVAPPEVIEAKAHHDANFRLSITKNKCPLDQLDLANQFKSNRTATASLIISRILEGLPTNVQGPCCMAYLGFPYDHGFGWDHLDPSGAMPSLDLLFHPQTLLFPGHMALEPPRTSSRMPSGGCLCPYPNR